MAEKKEATIEAAQEHGAKLPNCGENSKESESILKKMESFYSEKDGCVPENFCVKIKEINSKLADTEILNLPYEQDPPALFNINGVEVVSKQAVTQIAGAKKNGKSNLAGLLMCAAIHPQHSILDGQLRCNIPNMVILNVDTEQPPKDARRTLRRVCKTAGHDYTDDWTQYNIHSHRVKDVGDWDDRKLAIQILLAKYAPDLLIIDGLADIVKSINNEEMVVEIMDWCARIAVVNDCAVVVMLHLNYGTQKISGWVGTQSSKKYSDCFLLKKSKSMFTAEHEGRGESAPDLRFRIECPPGDKFGWWEAVDVAAIDEMTEEDKKKQERLELVETMPLPCYNKELVQWLMNRKNWKTKSPADKFLKDCKEDGVLDSRKEGNRSLWFRVGADGYTPQLFE